MSEKPPTQGSEDNNRDQDQELLLPGIDGPADLHDLDDEQLGKPHGSDERHGKLTYVSLFGLERARELAAESHAKATGALAEAEGETDDLRRVADYIFTRNK